ncbi:MAG: SagB/ThcOx family dehydrogenase [Anaerolineaceae bacterium]|nr:SagB/ThcOx family dehydrogenase [Anaerolineaceae bacterium]
MSNSIGREFIRKTAVQYLPVSPEESGVPQPPLELPYPHGARLIALPDAASVTTASKDLQTVIENRKSVRAYSGEALTLEELSCLLWLTQGVRGVNDRPATLRNVPSAGARHAFETYLLINNVEGIQPGLYRYAALKHALLELEISDDLTARVTRACLNQQKIGGSAVTFIWAVVIERMVWRYPERGYRYMLLDAGHICQNLYLAAEALDCAVCAIGSFDDDLLNTELGLDGETVFAVYAGTLGKQIKA